jgi:hypothetical protein
LNSAERSTSSIRDIQKDALDFSGGRDFVDGARQEELGSWFKGERAMCESTSKPVVFIPSASPSEAIQSNPDRPLWVLNETGRAMMERRSSRNWDGETISLDRFFKS